MDLAQIYASILGHGLFLSAPSWIVKKQKTNCLFFRLLDMECGLNLKWTMTNQ